MKMEAALNRLQANKHDAGGWLIFWDFDEQDRVMLHFCGMDGVFDLARVFETSYEIAKANIANFCG